jgi:hypothetical protein
MRSADVLRLEADIAIQLERPTTPDVKVVRLGRIHSMPAAAPSYLDIYGTRRTVDGAVVGHHQGRRQRPVADLHSRHGTEDGAARYRCDISVRSG